MKLLIYTKKEQGILAVSAVLIISAIVVAVAITVALLSIGEAQSALVLSKGEENLNLVEGCVDDVLLKVRSNSSYSGGTLTHPEGTCTVTVNSGNPSWDITVTSQTMTYQRKIQVIFTRSSGGITLTSWQEI